MSATAKPRGGAWIRPVALALVLIVLAGLAGFILVTLLERAAAPAEREGAELELTLTPSLGHLDGKLSLRFRAPAGGLGELVLPLHRRLRLHYLHGPLVAGFQHDASELAPTDSTAALLYIPLRRNAREGELLELTLRYSGRFPAADSGLAIGPDQLRLETWSGLLAEPDETPLPVRIQLHLPEGWASESPAWQQGDEPGLWKSESAAGRQIAPFTATSAGEETER